MVLEDGWHSGNKKLGQEPLVPRGWPCNVEKPRVFRGQGWTWGAGDGDDEKDNAGDDDDRSHFLNTDH